MSEQRYPTLSPLVQVGQKNIAHLFVNYLLTLGIQAQVVEADKQSDLETELAFTIICQHDKLTQAKHEFEQFIKQPYDHKYQQAAWQHGETVDIDNHDLTLVNTFRDNFLAHAGVVTLAVFILCWMVFLASDLGLYQFTSSLKFYTDLSFHAFIQEPWRLIGPAFFHFSWLHIVFNTMWWWQLGGSIEKTLGKGALINLLLISSIFSNVGQFLVSGSNFGGLSGVVYALMGFMWWYGYLAPEKGLFIPKPIVSFLLVWLVLGFAELLPVNMANTAHLLGLLSGCLLAVLNVKFFNKSA